MNYKDINSPKFHLSNGKFTKGYIEFSIFKRMFKIVFKISAARDRTSSLFGLGI